MVFSQKDFDEPDLSSAHSMCQIVTATPRSRRSTKPGLACVLSIAIWAQGCGGKSSYAPPPVVLTVTVSNPVVSLSNDGAAVYVQVIIVAPTETASFVIGGLPGGVVEMYKESESNPSGLLTLTAAAATPLGTYMPQITVGSSGQTASTSFTLVVQAAAK